MAELNALGIVVGDMATSIRFYRLLGVDLPETPGEGHVEAALLSLAFECASPVEVDETYARATGAGFKGEKEPWDAFWGQRYAQLQDPDGVPVDLFAALPTD
jgi:uncharacterized glyoxalase superfamily protein PhnB